MSEVSHSAWSAHRIGVTAAHVFVDDLDAPALVDDDAHHLARVLRLRDGEAMTVGDGAGRWRMCRYRAGTVEPDGDIQTIAAASPSVTVAFALTKGDKPELTVQKLTELGVDRVVPMTSARSIVQWDPDKAARNVRRLRTVARAAAMQARRPFLPTVADVVAFADFAAGEPALKLAHPDGVVLDAEVTTIAVGPEGGWSEDELQLVPRHVDLGPTTLRAETAALAAGVLMTALRNRRDAPS
jgi:16S rRNA (uracil1498-N3)-methyltransferase